MKRSGSCAGATQTNCAPRAHPASRFIIFSTVEVAIGLQKLLACARRLDREPGGLRIPHA